MNVGAVENIIRCARPRVTAAALAFLAGACASSAQTPPILPEPKQEEEEHAGATGSEDTEQASSGADLADRVFGMYGESPCWQANFRESTYPHRSQGSFSTSGGVLTWSVEGRPAATYSLLDKTTFHQLLFLVPSRKSDFKYRATSFDEPQTEGGYRFSSILDATPLREGVGIEQARFLLDDDFRVIGARLTLDAEGRVSTTRFRDWANDC